MKQQHVIKKQVRIKADPAAVWEALTDPRLTKKYFFGCAVYSDWKVGSSITFKRKFLWMKIELSGKIQKIEPERLLQYTLRNSRMGKGESQSLVTDELSYKNEKTTLSITDDVGKGEGLEKRYRKSDRGWDKILKGLKKLVEKRYKKQRDKI